MDLSFDAILLLKLENLNMDQLRNFAAKYWPDYGIDDLRRIAIVGHDETELKKVLEESRRLKEILESLGVISGV
ncbi:hypothetical protein [Archaeoglobus veneficus]|uniref:Uncharacterized protein n=1 Tax=Archaeoglobus veneficus (strain DSM 11195 / SNP6) TaxID=693661 RepID=F2KRA0_ARCVS|nr:hypothetical protein [Archaeoglobus veneficus]AEA47834.1 hypothetical protein Arcve_1838 [Archaeoglobus veneficus SNP6]